MGVWEGFFSHTPIPPHSHTYTEQPDLVSLFLPLALLRRLRYGEGFGGPVLQRVSIL